MAFALTLNSATPTTNMSIGCDGTKVSTAGSPPAVPPCLPAGGESASSRGRREQRRSSEMDWGEADCRPSGHQSPPIVEFIDHRLAVASKSSLFLSADVARLNDM